MEFIKLDVNTDMIIKKRKTGGIKYHNCECCIEYTIVKDNLILEKFLFCNGSKSYQRWNMSCYLSI